MKVLIDPADKNGAVCDLRFMALTWFKLYFAFQTDISGGKQSLVEIGINSPDRKIQFRMASDGLTGRLPLFYEGWDNPVFFMKFLLSKIDSGSGIRAFFMEFPVGKPCVIGVFMGNFAMIGLLGASIANVRCFIQPAASFLFKVFAGLLTCRTGDAPNTAKNSLCAGIGLFAVIAMGYMSSVLLHLPVNEFSDVNLCINIAAWN